MEMIGSSEADIICFPNLVFFNYSNTGKGLKTHLPCRSYFENRVQKKSQAIDKQKIFGWARRRFFAACNQI
tara:strand:- start:158 stop:370 length:213 start_codon:yes stop_codon:yes gene_type:complete